ncbi:hypothetical protein [Paraglaciecola sp. 2405UD69-4]|uniref:hypothetical protein n=1 Tax=Paraglaciecola sp. 2405UD69-4 TaxID=3391836 RepID=UPI0039C90859
MSINFLCPDHRNWVYFHPQEALSYLDDAQGVGEKLLREKDWQEATAYLGCAFETTEILMELQGATKSFLLGRLTVLASMLANAFYHQKAYQYQEQIITQAKANLHTAAQASLGNKPRLAYIQECIASLKADLVVRPSAEGVTLH